MAITVNYQSIKSIGKQLRKQGYNVTANDLIVLAPQNDPFYAGSPAQRRDGEWFARMYAKVGGTHLRRVHYRILEELTPEEKRLPIVLTTKDKKTKEVIEFTFYQNYERCWDYLNGAAKAARYLNLVPIDAFVDNRAKEATFSFYTHYPHPDDEDFIDPTPRYSVSGERYDLTRPELPQVQYMYSHFGDLPEFSVEGYIEQQPYHIEIWVEKSEGEDVFLPLCERYRVNFVPGVGDMSITTTYRFCERVRQANRPAKLLYVSDFDPSGFNMPVAVARKLEHFVRNHGFDDLDITLEPILLTAEQVEIYGLPPAPVKESDARKDEWESMYGGAVELNAMFSNDRRIAEARRIVEEAILQYYDTSLYTRTLQARRDLRTALKERLQEILDDELGDEWDGLEEQYQAIRDGWHDLQSEVDQLLEPIKPKVKDYQEQVDQLNKDAADLYEKILARMKEVDIDAENEFPLPETTEASTDEVLYHSRRGYFNQLEAYCRYKNGDYGPEFYRVLRSLDGLLI